ncbi:MAG: hypothetical protein HUJ68_03300 [Clostridia bacterium]|nr:hypothetical protein [Clostridia bacterium]
MKKSLLIFITILSLFFCSCLSPKGEFIMPPKIITLHINSGKAQIGTEAISNITLRSTRTASDLSEDPLSVFNDRPESKLRLNNLMTVSAGETYEIIIPYSKTVNVYITPLMMEDCIFTYTDFGKDYSFEVKGNNIFGNLVRFSN